MVPPLQLKALYFGGPNLLFKAIIIMKLSFFTLITLLLLSITLTFINTSSTSNQLESLSVPNELQGSTTSKLNENPSTFSMSLYKRDRANGRMPGLPKYSRLSLAIALNFILGGFVALIWFVLSIFTSDLFIIGCSFVYCGLITIGYTIFYYIILTILDIKGPIYHKYEFEEEDGYLDGDDNSSSTSNSTSSSTSSHGKKKGKGKSPKVIGNLLVPSNGGNELKDGNNNGEFPLKVESFEELQGSAMTTSISFIFITLSIVLLC